MNSLFADRETARLGQRTVQGGAFTVFSQGSRFVIQMVSLAVLARLLDPRDFGLIAMVAVIIRFMDLVSNLGLVQATVQRPKITHEEVSKLFWFNGVVGLTLTLAVFFSAPFVASFYNEPALEGIVVVLCIAVFTRVISLQHRALLERNYKFRDLAIIEILVSLVSVSVAIALAWVGVGYWALVVQQILMSVLFSASVILLSGWLPGLPRHRVAVKPYLKYGLNLAGFNFLNFFARNTDNAVVGKLYGGASLALYEKAYSLLMLPINQINTPLSRVLLPAMSQLVENPIKYKNAYQRSLSTLAYISVPIIVFAGLATEEIIMVILGPAWIDSVSIFRALLPAALIGATNMATGWVYLSIGHTDRQFKFSFVTTAVTVSAILVGSQFGVLGTAVGFSSACIFLRIPDLLYCFNKTPLRLTDFFISIWRPYCVSIGSGVVVAIFSSYWALDNVLESFFLKIVCFVFAFFSIDYLVSGTKATSRYLDTLSILKTKKIK